MTSRSVTNRVVHVDLGERSYDIVIGSATLGSLPKLLAERCPSARHSVVITDSNVEKLHAVRAAEALGSAEFECDVLVVDAGESSKSIETAEALWRKMLELGADRKTIVVAVGGGVVGDLAGFVAATFARGVPFFQVPTTLLAQVDSSVGGKVGVNLPEAKNMVGAFWQPLGVVAETDALATLPDREYRSGLAEVVKYGVILDAELFSYLENEVEAINRRDPAVLEHLVARCCRLKADVVEQDERELTGRRAVLNYGHTLGHAIEAVAGYGKYLHGEAVAIGMMMAARLAGRLGRVGEEMIERQRTLLLSLHLPVALTGILDEGAMFSAMQHDKKVRQGRIRFVLPSRLGHVELVDDVSPDDVRSALQG